jgi:cytochrome P450
MILQWSRLDWGAFASLVRYGERWRAYRRLMNPWLHKQAATAFHGSQEHEAQLLLQRLLNKCNELDSSEELEAELSL